MIQYKYVTVLPWCRRCRHIVALSLSTVPHKTELCVRERDRDLGSFYSFLSQRREQTHFAYLTALPLNSVVFFTLPHFREKDRQGRCQPK